MFMDIISVVMRLLKIVYENKLCIKIIIMLPLIKLCEPNFIFNLFIIRNYTSDNNINFPVEMINLIGEMYYKLLIQESIDNTPKFLTF